MEDRTSMTDRELPFSILRPPSSELRKSGWRQRWGRGRRALGQFLYGATGYEFARHALQMRRQMEAVFMVVTMGDLVGVPILPPSYSMRLLPYVVPDIAKWKRETARRRDFWEREELDLHGV